MGKPLHDLVGQRFGRLVAVKYVGGSKWLCKCDCGNETIVDSSNLVTGGTKSCGCLRIERARESMNVKHGESHSRLYPIWHSMKQRCQCPTHHAYERYGGRGIKVCDEWQEFEPFMKWAMANGYDPDAPRGVCTLDRADNNGDYRPDNCRWVDMRVQSNNRRKYRIANSRRVIQEDMDGNTIAVFESLNEASVATGVQRSGIGFACRKKYKQAGGYRWRYADENETKTVPSGAVSLSVDPAAGER